MATILGIMKIFVLECVSCMMGENDIVKIHQIVTIVRQ
jgi:hypothetical protein